MIEVLKQALEVIETAIKAGDWKVDGACDPDNVIYGLRQAIAELESQEPDKYEMDIECTKCGAKQSGVLTVNTHPPQRTWQGLTADEIWDEWFEQSKPERNTHNFVVAFTRAIEAKLKQKNGFAEEKNT